MASKVLVNLATTPFQQVNKSTISKYDGYSVIYTDPAARIHQLEQNIRFLQEQHQLMLSGLQQEIEQLRSWNRDLQIKLVFSKGGVALLQSSPSSPEDDTAQHKLLLSPNTVNITPLKIELLERDIAELKTNLSEARTRNVYLQNIVDEQKKKLSGLEMAAVGKKTGEGKENVGKGKQVSVQKADSVEELQEKMENADRLIRRLRRENEEQRKEIMCLRTSMSKSMAEGRRDGHRAHFRNHQQTYNTRFPPLQPQSQYSQAHKTSDEYRNKDKDLMAHGLQKDSQIVGKPVPMLPHLRDRNNPTTSSGFSNYFDNYQHTGNVNHRRHYYRRQQDDGNKGGGGGRGHRSINRQQTE